MKEKRLTDHEERGTDVFLVCVSVVRETGAETASAVVAGVLERAPETQNFFSMVCINIGLERLTCNLSFPLRPTKGSSR